MSDRPMRLTRAAIAQAASVLAESDASLKPIFQRHGPPPLLRRPASYATLVRIILEQQVSVAAAVATFDRLREATNGDVQPQSLMRIGDEGLQRLGFSRQKAGYALTLAEEIAAGRFRVDGLSRLDDDTVRNRLVAQKGLGNWSADVFLMMALLRPDVLPVGDLALVKGLGEIDETEFCDRDQILERAERWRPYRSVATRMVWQAYVSARRRTIV